MLVAKPLSLCSLDCTAGSGHDVLCFRKSPLKGGGGGGGGEVGGELSQKIMFWT